MSAWAIENGTFPILRTLRQMRAGYPQRFPMSALEPHRKQAEKNHCGQTLEQLAARGGLGPSELYQACHGERLLFDRAECEALAPRIRTWIDEVVGSA